MEALDRIIKVLFDGYWHEVNELHAEVDLTEEKLGKALEFLKDYGFIHLSKGSVKLTAEMLRLQQGIKELGN